MKKIIYLLIVLSIALFIFNSCKKKEELEKEPIKEIYTIPLGDYQDTLSKRATMTVSFKNKVYCIEINWANSAFENNKWNFSGVYNVEKHGIIYNNEICVIEDYNEDGDCTTTEVYHDGKGSMIYDNGKLYWLDEQEEKNDDINFNAIFEKIDYED